MNCLRFNCTHFNWKYHRHQHNSSAISKWLVPNICLDAVCFIILLLFICFSGFFVESCVCIAHISLLHIPFWVSIFFIFNIIISSNNSSSTIVDVLAVRWSIVHWGYKRWSKRYWSAIKCFFCFVSYHRLVDFRSFSLVQSSFFALNDLNGTKKNCGAHQCNLWPRRLRNLFEWVSEWESLAQTKLLLIPEKKF